MLFEKWSQRSLGVQAQYGQETHAETLEDRSSKAIDVGMIKDIDKGTD
jgi:hypothetical protein